MALTTDVAIRKWKPLKDGEAQGIGGRSGLYVRGWRAGGKAFYARLAGTWVKVADYGEMTLAEARELAPVTRRLAKEGWPAGAFRAAFEGGARTAAELEAAVRNEELPGLPTMQASARTYDAAFQAWHGERKAKLQAGPSRRRPEAIHENHVAPVLGRRPVPEITRPEIVRALKPVFAENPVTAGYALQYVRAVLDWAVDEGWRDGNPTPPARSFASIKPERAVRHHGTIAADRLPELWRQVQATGAGASVQAAILTLMVTGHRLAPVLHARWADLDAAGVWTVPARTHKAELGRMKSGRAYSLKIPPGLLRQWHAARANDCALIFPSPTDPRRPVSGAAVLKVLKRIEDGMTAHGFRNAVKTWCRTAKPPVPDHIADAFLDHSLRGLDAAYRRADTSRARAELAARLYRFVTGGDE